MDNTQKKEMLEKEMEHIHKQIMEQNGAENILRLTEAQKNIIDMIRLTI